MSPWLLPRDKMDQASSRSPPCYHCCGGERTRRAQVVRRLQGDLPVWVRGDAWETAGEELDDIFIGDAEIWCDPSWHLGLICHGARHCTYVVACRTLCRTCSR